MRSFVVEEVHHQKKLMRVLGLMFPHLPKNAMYKALRNKDIRVSGVRVKEDVVLSGGEKIDVYIPDAVLDGVPSELQVQNTREKNLKKLEILYEDSNILVANKWQGISVQEGRTDQGETLLEVVSDYLRNESLEPQMPALCHRLDRNTGGLILFAKNHVSKEEMEKKIKQGMIKKYYTCLVQGRVSEKKGVYKAYLEKDSMKSRVFISNKPGKRKLAIETGVEVLNYIKAPGHGPSLEDSSLWMTLLEVELITGRTHQIRAHLAYMGHPILGDGKYGSYDFNQAYLAKFQYLWATRLSFAFKDAEGILGYLKGKQIKVKPDFSLYPIQTFSDTSDSSSH
jgi:23S rRNA pseudouridine955/2504/2580 synthase